MGQPALSLMPMAWLVWVAAMRGEEEYGTRLAELEQALLGRHAGILIPHIDQVLRLARGAAAGFADPAGAFAQLELVANQWEVQLCAVDRLEAAARAGRPDRAQQWTEELEGFAAATGQSWAHAAAAHGRALLTEGPAAEAHFRQALSHHAGSTRPFNRARTQLAYGEFLRRLRRRVDAREQLRGALAGFEELGARVWADRAREELRASGEAARKRDGAADVKLTAQELQVAGLVQEGLTNREVAARLFVSPRTIDFHLRNVFAKLGITSRAALLRLELDQQGG
jgi:DNA-binding CsgD family transcriptional regulator